jgi:hypothetical protein
MARFLKLEDVEKTASQHPDSFYIPPKEERKNQKNGYSVRLHFLLDNPSENDPRAERMWVTITQEEGLFKPYKGTLENEPVYIENLRFGDEITFKSSHIAQTIIKKGDPRWIDSAELSALVSKMCMIKGEVVRFLYREKSDRKEDSGWRMFTGHETDEYNEDARNISIQNLGFMLDRDPTLLEPLKEGVGAVYEREDKGKPWTRVTDWSPTE